jgi:hypothetical protein
MAANMESMQERMDANQAELKIAMTHMKWEKLTSEDMEHEVAHEEVPKEDATVIPVGEPGNRRRDQRNLAAGCHQKEQARNLDTGRRRKQQNRTQSKDWC